MKRNLGALNLTWLLSWFSRTIHSPREKHSCASTFPSPRRVSKKESTHTRAILLILLLRMLQRRPCRRRQAQRPDVPPTNFNIPPSIGNHLLLPVGVNPSTLLLHIPHRVLLLCQLLLPQQLKLTKKNRSES
ncbi:hypothetical protein V8G54_018316 [Vigna mungo]|uniref:Uncharacterized protein n=1 Tax=Vigna mungo TaxID=3915 RepID=A0AAQ3N8M0_VIGMU